MAELTTNTNFLQPTQFSISISRTRFGNLQFFAQQVSHPGLSVASATVPVPRLGTLAIPGDTAQFDELSMDIIVDEDMEGYVEMFNWLNDSLQNDFESPRNVTNDDPYIPQADITLTIRTSHNNVSRRIKYINCVPTSIGALSFQSTATDATPLTFPVTFRIEYFEIE